MIFSFRNGELRDWTSLPVTSIVSVTVDEGDFDAVVEEVFEVFEPAITRVVAYASEGCADCAGTLGPVERDTHFFLDPLLVEEALVERRRRRRRVQGCDVVVVATAVEDVRVEDVRATEGLSCFADVVDGVVYAQVLRITHGRCLAAIDDLVSAGARTLEGVGHVLPLGFIDGLDSVGVVVRHGWIGRPLDEAIDAAVDDHQSVNVQNDIFAVIVYKGAVLDTLVLFFEVGGEGWAVAATLIRRQSLRGQA